METRGFKKPARPIPMAEAQETLHREPNQIGVIEMEIISVVERPIIGDGDSSIGRIVDMQLEEQAMAGATVLSVTVRLDRKSAFQEALSRAVNEGH